MTGKRKKQNVVRLLTAVPLRGKIYWGKARHAWCVAFAGGKSCLYFRKLYLKVALETVIDEAHTPRAYLRGKFRVRTWGTGAAEILP